jgi:hypothetical protein
MKPKETEFEKFDRVTGGLFTIPHSELQEKMKKETRNKQKGRKKQAESKAVAKRKSAR